MASKSRSEAIRRFDPNDEGKPVVTADGERIGAVDAVRNGRAYVTPTAGLLDGRGSILVGWLEPDEPMPLAEGIIADVTETSVVLKAADSHDQSTTDRR